MTGAAAHGGDSRAADDQAGEALARNAFWVLAQLAAQRISTPVTLDRSAPAVSTRGGAELSVAVSFDPRTRQFVASRLEGAQSHTVHRGPSLSLACAAANQAFEALAPLETLIVVRPRDLYRRTHPQYLQEIHFCDALKRLGEVAGADGAAVSGVSCRRGSTS